MKKEKRQKIRKEILSKCCKAPVIEYDEYDKDGEEIPAHNMFCSKCFRGVYSFIEAPLSL